MLHNFEQTANEISHHEKSDKVELMYLNQDVAITSLNVKPLKPVHIPQ